MEALLEKKPPKTNKRWQSRLFRLKDRRLMHFKKGITDFNTAMDSSAKYILDLTYLTSLSVDKKHENVLIINHPVIDLALRFKTSESFICWLKVFASFTKATNGNGPKVQTSIPSNYLYSIWNVLQSLYSHPNLEKIEGIFRIAGDKNEKNVLFNDLLQQTYDINNLQNYKNIHVLAKLLSSLLSNLPSTIFKEKEIGNLISFFDSITSGTNIKRTKHVDDDVSGIPMQIINNLKHKIETLYLAVPEDRNRYGLMTLIFHLLKQITMNEELTKMSAESMSTIFAEIFDSKIFLIKLKDPMQMLRSKYLVKALIFWAYDIFPEQEWCIKDIVIAEKCEIAYINSFSQSKKTAKHKKQSKSGQWRDKYLLSKKQVSKKHIPETEEKEGPKHKKQSKSGQWRDKYLLSKKQVSKKQVHEKPAQDFEQKAPQKAPVRFAVVEPPPMKRSVTMSNSFSPSTKIVSHFKNPSLSAKTDLNLTDFNMRRPLQRSYTMGHADDAPDSDMEMDEEDGEEDILFDLWDDMNHNEAETIITGNAAEKKQDENTKTKRKMGGVVGIDKERKKRASFTVNKLLTNRPTPKELHKQHIIDAKAAVFYGALESEMYAGNMDKETFIAKMRQRPTWKEVNSRGILLDSNQRAQRLQHKRNASGTVDKMLMNRPTPNELHSQNIIDTNAALFYGALESEMYADNMDKEQFVNKLSQRPSWTEVNSRGIVLDSNQRTQRNEHKRNASGTVNKLLLNRPTPNDLHSQNIIDATAALFYGALESEIYADNMDKEQFVNKLSQRPSWTEVNSRGIVLDSNQRAQRKAHKRNASGTINKLLTNRPTPNDLHSQNIIDSTAALFYGAAESDIYSDNVDKEQFVIKLKQRPSWKEVNSRGILLDSKQREQKQEHKRNASGTLNKLLLNRASWDDVNSRSKQSNERKVHKRNASKTINKFLANRPAPNELHSQNIIDSTTALFYGAAKSDIYCDNMDKEQLAMKLQQRPTVDETVARGILLHRTDNKINYDLQRRHKQLQKRRTSEKIEKFMFKRPTKNELKDKGILMTDAGVEKKRRHKRQTSQDLEAGLKKRTPFEQMKYDSKYSDPKQIDPKLNVYRDMVKLFQIMYSRRIMYIK